MSDPLLAHLCLVVACNDEAQLQRNLMASDMVAQGVPVQIERGVASASIAYNRGLDATTVPYVIFAHQDVYFPPGWEKRLAKAIDWLDQNAPDWALVAPFGMALDGTHRGDVFTTSLSRRVGQPVTTPLPVQSFDELVIVLRRASGLRFDEGLPRFHLYGTDIVQTALTTGKSAHVADLPLVHNDGFHDRLRADFGEAYAYVRRKWRARLPLRTPVLWITKTGLALAVYRLRARRSIEKRRALAGDTTTDPKVFSATCGWEAGL